MVSLNIPGNVRDQILSSGTELGRVLWEAMLKDKIEMANPFDTTHHIDQQRFLPTDIIPSNLSVIRGEWYQRSICIAGDIYNFRLQTKDLSRN